MIFLFIISIAAALLLSYPFLLWVLSRLYKPIGAAKSNEKEFSYACIITAYNNVDIARLCADSLVNQTYPNYKIFVVADGDDEQDTDSFDPAVQVIKPEKKLGSKVRSLFYALSMLDKDYDYLVVFDPDNLAHPGFLAALNRRVASGVTAIQGRRTAKNLDSVYACLDAAGEFFYNYFQRNLTFRLGSSALISGSGMAIKTDEFRSFFDFRPIKENINNVIPGEDKLLQYYLVSRGGRIAYAPDAILYDEKVSSGYQVQRQRTRWLNTYFGNLRYNLSEVSAGLIRGSLNRFIFGLTSSFPPLFILAGGSVLLSILFIFLNIAASLIVVGGLFVFFLTMLLFLKLAEAPDKVFKSLIKAPVFILKQILALIRMKSASKDFMPTENKNMVSLEDVMKQK